MLTTCILAATLATSAIQSPAKLIWGSWVQQDASRRMQHKLTFHEDGTYKQVVCSYVADRDGIPIWSFDVSGGKFAFEGGTLFGTKETWTRDGEPVKILAPAWSYSAKVDASKLILKATDGPESVLERHNGKPWPVAPERRPVNLDVCQDAQCKYLLQKHLGPGGKPHVYSCQEAKCKFTAKQHVAPEWYWGTDGTKPHVLSCDQVRCKRFLENHVGPKSWWGKDGCSDHEFR